MNELPPDRGTAMFSKNLSLVRLNGHAHEAADPLAALLVQLAGLSEPLSITIRRPGLVVELVARASVDQADELVARVNSVDQADGGAGTAPLPDIQANILEALGTSHMTARRLAERAGYKLTNHFRGVLATMRRLGLLHHDDVGYFQPAGAGCQK